MFINKPNKQTKPPNKLKPKKKNLKDKKFDYHMIFFLIIIQLQIVAYMNNNTSNFKIVIRNVQKVNIKKSIPSAYKEHIVPF